MGWTRGWIAAVAAAVLIAGCTERDSERTRRSAERAGERTEGALERGAERTAEAGREVAEEARELGREIAGTVKRVTNDVIEVGDRELRIGEDTEFFRDGERIGREEVRPGDEVRAAFDEAGDALQAKRVEVKRRAQ